MCSQVISLLKRYWIVCVVILILGSIIIFLPYDLLHIQDAKILITALTFLYGIVGGFAISTAWGEFRQARTLISEDDGLFKSAWFFVESFDKKSIEKIRILMDKILVLGYYLNWSDKIKTDKLIKKTFNNIKKLKAKTPEQQQCYARLLTIIVQWWNVRTKLYILGKSKISKLRWLILIILGALLITSFFTIRTENILFDLIIFFTSSTIVLVIFLIHNLDNYSFNDIIWGSGDAEFYEELFDLIGMPYYYPEELIKNNIIKPKGKGYRTKVPKDYLKEIK